MSGPVAFAENQRNEVRLLSAAGAVASIRRGDAKNETLLAEVFQHTGSGAERSGSPSLAASDDNGSNQVVVAFDKYNQAVTGDHAHTLAAGPREHNNASVPHVVAPIDMRQASRGGKATNNRRAGSSGGPPGTGVGEAGDPSPTIAGSHTPAVVCVTGERTHALTTKMRGATEDGTGRGTPIVATEEPVATYAELGEGHQTYQEAAAAAALRAGSGGGSKVNNLVATRYVVRRLTPVECQRLQNLPDWWLDLDPPLSDSAKYRMTGNAGVVACVEWILSRLRDAVRRVTDGEA